MGTRAEAATVEARAEAATVGARERAEFELD